MFTSALISIQNPVLDCPFVAVAVAVAAAAAADLDTCQGRAVQTLSCLIYGRQIN